MSRKNLEKKVEYDKSHPREKARGSKSHGTPKKDKVIRETKRNLSKNNK